MPAFANDCETNDGTAGGGENCGEDPDNPAPVDGGVTILLGLSTIYGVKKLKSSYQKEIL